MNWKIDSTHSEVQFKVKHLVISTVTGNFTAFEGQLESQSENNFENAKVSFELNVASISTNQIDRDKHLKSADFFDVEQYPKISFTNGQLIKKSNSDYVLEGNLSIKSTTKPITLAVEFGGIMKDPWGNIKVGFEINGKINRADYGITWNALTEAGGLLVGEEVKLAINVQLIKA